MEVYLVTEQGICGYRPGYESSVSNPADVKVFNCISQDSELGSTGTVPNVYFESMDGDSDNHGKISVVHGIIIMQCIQLVNITLSLTLSG